MASYLGNNSLTLANIAISDRMILVLRVLGRLEYMMSSHIHATIYQSFHKSKMYRDLQKLREHDLVWSITAPCGAAEKREDGTYLPPKKWQYVYGLTNTGKALLESLGVEPDLQILQHLKARDPRGRHQSSLFLMESLAASWFCANILECSRRSRYIQKVHIQMRYAINDLQCMSALILLRLSRTPDPNHNLDVYPLFEGMPPTDNTFDIRLALEIDTDMKPLIYHRRKAEVYRDLTAHRAYHKALGGFVVPVILTSSSRRAAEIGREWKLGWPGGAALISTMRGADDLVLGVLWGKYVNAMGGGLTNLLSEANVDPQTKKLVLDKAFQYEDWEDDFRKSGLL